MQVKSIINNDLLHLREHFQDLGFDIRFVGGCVRDLITGHKQHDIDLCTDASPDEQSAIYTAYGIDNIPTGAQHGTYTVVMNGVGYEITSLRTEQNHDGRHAVMTFTKDWNDDLARRDLTINSMALTFDGVLLDPFNGQADLTNKVVRFVGNASDRIEEDYLRILRYFRFLGRYGSPHVYIDDELLNALNKHAVGLNQISAERIWVEMKKITSHPSGKWVIPLMIKLGVFDYVRLPRPDHRGIKQYCLMIDNGITNPVMLISSFFIGGVDVIAISRKLKWSTDERMLALEIVRYDTCPEYKFMLQEIVLTGRNQKLTAEVARYFGEFEMANMIDGYQIPVFPVTGDDLIASGVKPGKRMGEQLSTMKHVWFNSGATQTKSELFVVFSM